MKVVAVLGSPRKGGNSASIAKRFLDTCKELGAETELFVLNDLTYRGCQACMYCKTGGEKCVLDDDLAPVLDAVQEADVLVMATPTYFGGVTGQLKSFVDRTYSFLLPDFAGSEKPSRLAPGKKLVFIQTQGYEDEDKFADLFPKFESFYKWFGYDEGHWIRACGVGDEGDVESRDDVMKLTKETARKVMAR